MHVIVFGRETVTMPDYFTDVIQRWRSGRIQCTHALRQDGRVERRGKCGAETVIYRAIYLGHSHRLAKSEGEGRRPT
ncbi:MAG: hypothetical protein LBU32_25555 [Clostridiales bacterium]|nr:hypothetical protein [Clostridiales bacterium]